jgi:hypothetical protein
LVADEGRDVLAVVNEHRVISASGSWL